MCSPGLSRVLNSVQSSGRWFLGCHWPKLSRCDRMRSLARAFSSSAPRAADQHVEPVLVDRFPSTSRSGGRCATRRARRDAPCRAPSSLRGGRRSTARRARRRSRRERRSPRGSCARCRTCRSGNGRREVGAPASLNAFCARCRTTHESLPRREQQRRPLEGGRGLAQHKDRFFLERVELGDVEFGRQHSIERRWVRSCGGSFGFVVRLDVQAALLGALFPPPPAGTEVFADGDGARARRAADARMEVVVQHVVRHVVKLNVVPDVGPAPVGQRIQLGAGRARRSIRTARRHARSTARAAGR